MNSNKHIIKTGSRNDCRVSTWDYCGSWVRITVIKSIKLEDSYLEYVIAELKEL